MWIGRHKDERKSTSRYTFILGGSVVLWCSKKQTCIALSKIETKYVACLIAIQEAVAKRFLENLKITTHAVSQLRCILIAWLHWNTLRILNIMAELSTLKFVFITYGIWSREARSF